MSKYRQYIDGKRIFLREVRVEDVTDTYYKWMNDSEVNQFLETRYRPQSLKSIEKFVQEKDGKSE